MDYWLTIIIVLLIVGIVFDGVRRMRNAKRDSLKMSLRPVQRDLEEHPDDDEYGSEFPNGGARVSERKIDPERIQKVRNKYNFGSDIPAWREKVANKIAEHTGMKKSESDEMIQASNRIEPSLNDEVDPLLDDLRESLDDLTTPDTQSAAQVADDEVNPEPVQTSLNLEDSVPMLMDSLEDTAGDEDSTQAQEIRPVASHIDVEPDDSDVAIETRSANKPRYESKYVDHAKQAGSQQQSSTNTDESTLQDVLVIHVKAAKNEYFYGSDLLDLILDNGLRFGEMDIFHCHAGEDGEGPVLFSMANMVKPGTFDLHSFEEFSTVGLSFFLALPTGLDNHMDAFDKMLSTAKNIADTLSGELNDEQRSILTGQTIEHYRERIRDFTRRQQLEKSKL